MFQLVYMSNLDVTEPILKFKRVCGERMVTDKQRERQMKRNLECITVSHNHVYGHGYKFEDPI